MSTTKSPHLRLAAGPPIQVPDAALEQIQAEQEEHGQLPLDPHLACQRLQSRRRLLGAAWIATNPDLWRAGRRQSFRHSLLPPPAVLETLPPLYATDGLPAEEKRVSFKLFDPCGAATWYILEGEEDPEAGWTFFAYVCGLGYNELGYVSLAELSNLRGRMNIGMERDIHYTAETLREVITREG